MNQQPNEAKHRTRLQSVPVLMESGAQHGGTKELYFTNLEALQLPSFFAPPTPSPPSPPSF